MSNEAEARNWANTELPAGVDCRQYQHKNPCESCQMVFANPNQVTCSRGACQCHQQGFPAQEMARRCQKPNEAQDELQKTTAMLKEEMERKGQKLKEEMQQELQKTTAMLKEEMERKGQKLKEEAQQELQRAQNKIIQLVSTIILTSALFVLLVAIVFSGRASPEISRSEFEALKAEVNSLKSTGAALDQELKQSIEALKAQTDLLKMKQEQSLSKIEGVKLEAQIDLLKTKQEQSLSKIEGVTLEHELKRKIEALEAQINLLKQELSSSRMSTEITEQHVESKQQRENDIKTTAEFRSITNATLKWLQDGQTQAAKAIKQNSDTIQQSKLELRGYGEELARLAQQVDTVSKRGWFSK